jgi:hypothetical protein
MYLHGAHSGFEPESLVHFRTWTWNASNKHLVCPQIICRIVHWVASLYLDAQLWTFGQKHRNTEVKCVVWHHVVCACKCYHQMGVGVCVCVFVYVYVRESTYVCVVTSCLSVCLEMLACHVEWLWCI